MSSTAPVDGRYWPISSRKRWRTIVKRAQQYARTTGSSYAATILRIVSLRIDPVSVPLPRHRVVGREPRPERGKTIDALVAAGRPPRLPEHDECRSPHAEPVDQLGAHALD